MFGYIKPMTSELKVREHELYKSVYCGLCAAMGEHICQSNRFTLSYDIVFLALVRTAMTDEPVHVEKRRCMVHPVKKRNRAFIPQALEYCSRAAVLTFYNIADDVTDTKGAASIRSRLLLPGAKRFLKKADSPEMEKKCADLLKKLSELEASGGSLDRNADIFGELLGYIFSYGLENTANYEAAKAMGYHCGKWIYIIDACDDFEKDKARGEYNPLSSFDSLPVEMLRISATLELADAKKAFDSAEIKNQAIASIITNILTLGMPERQDMIFKENEKNERSL
ncbi:MAG: hypothetical protein E7652_06965 [Ruminococcaceae bacterium]|nr:hypothetical protein [Oscillospiraceae bacterium]